MDKHLRFNKRLLMLVCVLLCSVGASWAFDFSATSNGQTLYYTITDNTNHYVKVVYPAASLSNDQGWTGFTKPTGNLTIPETVTYDNTTYTVTGIGNWAFAGCTELNSVSLPSTIVSPTANNNNSNGLWFKNCSGLTSITLPSSTEFEAIPYQMCSMCTSLTSVTIPLGVTQIQSYAFTGCGSLTSVTVQPDTPPTLDETAFFSINKANVAVYVPCGTLYTFKSAANWSDFPNIRQTGCSYNVTEIAYPAQGGTVLGGGGYSHGQMCTLTATPNTGYHFVKWTKDGYSNQVSTDANYTFSVQGTASYYAHFSLNEYQITATVNSNVGGTVTGAGTYTHGTTCTLTATPSEGYSFVSWKKNGIVVSTDASYSFTVTAAGAYEAYFSFNSYTIAATANPVAGGTVTGSGTYTHGSTCTLTASTAEGYTFYNWSSGSEVLSTETTYSFTVTSDKNIQANFIIPNAKPAGALEGLFSINSTQIVWFSQGNLQYQASSDTWRFAEHQYDKAGSTSNGNISSTYSGWIDLFGWGTSGRDHGATCYQPWSTDAQENRYYAYGEFQYNLYDQTGQADWGYNAISNGSDMPNLGWRTLKQEEWSYLLNLRNTTSDVRYAKATVNNVKGLILLPDDWNTSYYSLNNTDNGNASFSSNTVSASDWATLEQHGAVFLPVAGSRNVSLVTGDNNAGYYWSSSEYDDSNASYVVFLDGSLNANYGVARSHGQSVRLVFMSPSHSIHTSCNPADGGSTTGDGVYEVGANCTLTATANTGYTFLNWTKDGQVVSTDATYSFSVTQGGWYVANFLPYYTVNATVSPSGAGSVTGTGTFDHGTTVTLTATSNIGYTFVNWTENGQVVSSDNPYSFEVTSDRQLVANFNTISCHWTPVTGMSNSMTMFAVVNIDGEGSYADYLELGAFSGSECRGTALPQFMNGYCFYPLNIAGNNDGEPITFRLYDHHQEQELDLYCTNELTFTHDQVFNYYTVYFINRVQITATADPAEGGTVSGAGGHFPGLQCTLTATAGTGYTFINWTLNGNVVSTDATYTFTVTEAASYVAHFSLNQYAITATADPEGSGTIAGTGTYSHFATCTLTATANTGYTFINWTLDGEEVSNNAEYTFEVSGAADYVAHFSLNSYEITASVEPAETGTVEGAGTYSHFEQCTLTATPATGYSFQSWTLDGTVVSTDAVYTFEVSGAGDYVAHFGLNSYTVAVVASPTEGGTVSGAGTYSHFQTCTLTATAATDFQFNRWEVDGITVSTEATYVFVVTGPVAVTAVFDYVQVIDLVEGWTWWSTSIELDDIEGLSMLEGSMGESGVVIKSSNAFVQYFPAQHQWYGTLSHLYNEHGYKVNVSDGCASTMIGPKVYPTDHPIPIQHNWNWIGYPSALAQYVTDALAGFLPENGDVIKGQGSFATYYTDLGWVPATFALTPGDTYLFFSNSEQGKTLTFGSGGRAVVEQTDDRHWRGNIHGYADNLCLTAVVTLGGEEQRSERLELAAFIDGECRGSAKLTYIALLDRYFALMTITGQEGEQVRFVLLDEENGLVGSDSPTHLGFVTDAVVGRLEEPFVVAFDGMTSMEEYGSHLTLYPNPVECGETFSLDIPEEEELTELAITNMLGAVVRHEQGALDKRKITGLNAPGLYLVRAVTRTGKVYECKLMVK